MQKTGSRMRVQQALDYFLGKKEKRLNCAQAIARAYQDVCTLHDTTIEQLRHAGNGRAPEGLCGAFYAAKLLLEISNPEKYPQLEVDFFQKARSFKCQEIRKSKTLSCTECVQTCAFFLQEIYKQ
jgi:hydroxypyruvate isomerase